MTEMDPVPTEKSSTSSLLSKVDATLIAWLAFLALGGGILALYYARIQYLPDIEWSSSIVYLAVAFLTGGVVGLILALSLLIPGYIWSAFLVFDENLKPYFRYPAKAEELCLRTLVRGIGVPFAIVLVLNHLALLVFPYIMPSQDWHGPRLLWAYAFVSLGILVFFGFYMRKRFRYMLDWIKKSRLKAPTKNTKGREVESKENEVVDQKAEDDQKREIFKYTGWFLLSVLLSQLSIILVFLLSNRPTGFPFFVTTIFCTLGVLISNHAVAIHYQKSRVQAIAASLIVASLLLFMADRNSSLSSQIMAYYGLGDRSQEVTLLLNDEGAKIIEQLEITNPCATSAPQRLCNVRVLSRLGGEYYLSLNGKTFTLPKSTILSRESVDAEGPTNSKR